MSTLMEKVIRYYADTLFSILQKLLNFYFGVLLLMISQHSYKKVADALSTKKL
jgi:hypothetical protein